MTLNEILKMIPRWYRAGLSVHLMGPPGVGKSDTIVSAIPLLEKLTGKNLGICIIDCSLLSIDAMGFMNIGELRGRQVSQFTHPPGWITREGKFLDEYDGGIMVLEEIDKAQPDIKKCLGELRLSGRFGPHMLPKGWVIWSAGNRAEDRSGTTRNFDHLINREVWVNVTHDLVSWRDWAFREGIHPTFIAFADQHPETVFSSSVPDKQQPWCTPRSYSNMAKALVLMGDGVNIPDDQGVRETAQGGIGAGAVAQLFSYIKLGNDLPKFEDVINNPVTTRVPQRSDSQMLMAFSLAAKATMDNIDAICAYMARLPQEFGVSFMTSVCSRDGSLVSSPAVTRWAATNSSLMIAISRI